MLSNVFGDCYERIMLLEERLDTFSAAYFNTICADYSGAENIAKDMYASDELSSTDAFTKASDKKRAGIVDAQFDAYIDLSIHLNKGLHLFRMESGAHRVLPRLNPDNVHCFNVRDPFCPDPETQPVLHHFRQRRFAGLMSAIHISQEHPFKRSMPWARIADEQIKAIAHKPSVQELGYEKENALADIANAEIKVAENYAYEAAWRIASIPYQHRDPMTIDLRPLLTDTSIDNCRDVLAYTRKSLSFGLGSR